MNIVAKTSLDQKKAQKEFRKHALPGIKIIETKPIHMQRNTFRIIGQQAISSPLFSHFVVVDQDGIQANRINTEKVYMYISMVQLTNHLTQIIPWLESQHLSEKQEEIFASRKDVEESYLFTLQTNEEILIQLQTLKQKIEVLDEKIKWTEEAFKEIKPVWKSFWELYEKRLQSLFKISAYLEKQHIKNPTQNSPLFGLYKEAYFNTYLFTDPISIPTPLVKNVNDFIQLNSQLGAVKGPLGDEKIVKKKEYFSYHFFKSMVYVLVAILIVVSMMSFAGKLHIASVVTTFILLCVVFYLGRVHDRELLKSIEKRLKTKRKEDLSQTQVIRRKYRRLFNDFFQHEQRRKKDEKPYHFHVSITKVPTWILLFSVILVGLGLLSLPGSQGTYLVPVGYLFFGVIFGLFAIRLPNMGIGQKNISLESEKLTIHKKVYESNNCNLIRMNSTYKYLYIHVNAHPDPIKYRVLKGEHLEVYTHISNWCKQNLVTFQIKG